ncbi:MAG: cytochrome c oxidase subunit II [Bacteroidota bacterium]|nr:cytochrome c oxidase subunit II [Flavisolibacter sp.]MDQ3844332.1 cytochrome c oxidase subunit II [Bacteroidota bacterium]MBD0286060.1 cytochrome c oxidase subunit II [Flavisolibacter sp.]MBD0297020.1 cytochrome c oxidase subunit II [Flavisolibacter sp.]MBD0350123.1 cytochrome c oxidase subunit II [Flavisolibacter sp.]
MQLDRFEKRVLMITGAILALFIFSMLYARSRYNDLPECLPYDKAYETPKVTKIDEKMYQVYAVAQMWQFQPSEIYIPVGSEVDFFVTSKDVVHGFNIYNKNVNLMAVYGNINKQTVKFDKPGVYTITCHEYCGVGHQNMQAQVIVGPPGP